MRARLLFLSVLVIAVVLILELLQVPEVFDQSQVHRAVEGNVIFDGIPANRYAVEIEVLEVDADPSEKMASDSFNVYTLALAR